MSKTAAEGAKPTPDPYDFALVLGGQDLERGRRLEVEETLGYAVRKGAELDIPLPTVDTCYRLLAGVNRHLQSKEQEQREGHV